MSPTAVTRQAVGVFYDTAALEEAVSELQSRGFDRAEIGFVSRVATPELAPVTSDSINAAVSDTDLRQGRVLGTSLAATVAALAAAGFAVATGGTAAVAMVAAVVAGGGAGVVGELVGKTASTTTDSFDDAAVPGGGVLLLVHVRDPEAEARALGILRGHAATDVAVRELAGTRP
jgi:hypothetical protein